MVRDFIISVVKNLGVVEGRMKLMKLLFFVDYERGENVTGADWVYHYYGPYSRKVIDVLGDLVLEGVVAEGYDPETGLYVYTFLGGDYDDSVDDFVVPVLEKYGDLSAEELKKLSYKVLDEIGVEPGEKILFMGS